MQICFKYEVKFTQLPYTVIYKVHKTAQKLSFQPMCSHTAELLTCDCPAEGTELALEDITLSAGR